MDDCTMSMLSAAEMVAMIMAGTTTSVALLELHLRRVAALNPAVNAVIMLDLDRARARAKVPAASAPPVTTAAPRYICFCRVEHSMQGQWATVCNVVHPLEMVHRARLSLAQPTADHQLTP